MGEDSRGGEVSLLFRIGQVHEHLHLHHGGLNMIFYDTLALLAKDEEH